MRIRLEVPVLLALISAVAVAAPAQAAPASVEGDVVVYTADGEEANDIRAGTDRRDAGWAGEIVDDAFPIPAGPGCGPSAYYDVACLTSGPVGFRIDAGGGDDQVAVYNTDDSTGTATVLGGPGNDTLQVLSMRAVLDGGPGDDLLQPDYATTRAQAIPTPGDIVRGGDGVDTVSYLGVDTTSTITVTLDGIANDGIAGEGDNIGADVENLVAPAFASVHFTGSAADNRLSGGSWDDTLVGGGGIDTLLGYGGNDTLDARDGMPGDRVDCGDGVDIAYVDEGDIVVDCEQVIVAQATRPALPTLRAKKIQVVRGKAVMKLRCAAAQGCAGRLVVTSQVGKGKPLLTARSRYTLKAGKSTTRLSVRRPAKRALANRGSLKAKVTFVPTSGKARTHKIRLIRR